MKIIIDILKLCDKYFVSISQMLILLYHESICVLSSLVAACIIVDMKVNIHIAFLSFLRKI